MATKTIIINTCDRCGHEQDMSKYTDGNEWGSARIAWSWDSGGRAYDGAAGGVSDKGASWLCMPCAAAFRKFMRGESSDAK